MFTRPIWAIAILTLAPALLAAQTATKPTLSYSTYLSADNDTVIMASTTDAKGYQYVTGYTYADNFPTTPNAYRRTPSPIFAPDYCPLFQPCKYQTMFVAKLNRDGTGLVYSTFIGDGIPASIAVDSAGNVYIVAHRGDTADMPTTSGAWRSTGNSESCDNGYCDLLIKLNATGSALVYSTYLQANWCVASFNGVAVDSTDHAFVVGTGGGGCLMTSGAFKTRYTQYSNAIVRKFTVDGSGLLYSTYVGQYDYSGWSTGKYIAVDSNDHAIITGKAFAKTSNTAGTGFPTSGHAYQRAIEGLSSPFVAKLSADGSKLLASTLLPANDVTSVAVGPFNDVYMVGDTGSTDFPITPGAPEPNPDPFLCNSSPCGNSVLMKLPMDFSHFVYSTYVDGLMDGGYVTVDNVGHAFVDSSSASTLIPLVKPTSSTGDVYLAELNVAGTRFLFSTRYGTKLSGTAGIGIDQAGNAYAAGMIFESGLPTTPNAFQSVNGNPYSSSDFGESGWAAKWNIPPCTLNSTDRTITICTAHDDATVPHKFLLAAGATDNVEVYGMKVYVDGYSVFAIDDAAHFNTYVYLAPGLHRITVKAWDKSGPFSKSIEVTVE